MLGSGKGPSTVYPNPPAIQSGLAPKSPSKAEQGKVCTLKNLPKFPSQGESCSHYPAWRAEARILQGSPAMQVSAYWATEPMMGLLDPRGGIWGDTQPIGVQGNGVPCSFWNLSSPSSRRDWLALSLCGVSPLVPPFLPLPLSLCSLVPRKAGTFLQLSGCFP